MPFVEPAVAHGFDEILLAERLQAFQKRRPDHTLLIGAVTAVARACAPGAKAVHRVGIHLVAVRDGVQLGAARRRRLVLSDGSPGAISVAPSTNDDRSATSRNFAWFPTWDNGKGSTSVSECAFVPQVSSGRRRTEIAGVARATPAMLNDRCRTTAEARIPSANRPTRCSRVSSL